MMQAIFNNFDPDLNNYLLILSCLVLFALTIAISFAKRLVDIVVLSSGFSMIISFCYLLMDAPDVAMTEVALGCCLSTCVLLNMVRIIECLPSVKKYSSSARHKFLPLILCAVFVSVLIFAMASLPEYGNVLSPVNQHVSKYYLENTNNEIGVKAFVAAILGSYRGFDTLGETAVVFLASLSVLLILSRKPFKKAAKKEENG